MITTDQFNPVLCSTTGFCIWNMLCCQSQRKEHSFYNSYFRTHVYLVKCIKSRVLLRLDDSTISHLQLLKSLWNFFHNIVLLYIFRAASLKCYCIKLLQLREWSDLNKTEPKYETWCSRNFQKSVATDGSMNHSFSFSQT